MSPTEKRRATRINRRAAVHFIANGKSCYGVVLNFSEIGLFIQTEHMFAVDSTITVPIRIGTDRVVELRGRVAWPQFGISKTTSVSAHTGMGIELFAAPEEYIRFIAQMREQIRKLPRGIEERFEVYHRVRFASGEDFLTQYTENLSRGGMFLATKEPLKQGESIKAHLEIPGIPEPLEVEGRVAYKLGEKEAQSAGRRSGVGIQFVNLTAETKARLHHYIQRLEVHRSRPERRLGNDIPQRGSLTQVLVPELLLGLLEKKATGTLLLDRENVHKLVYIRSGQPVFIESNLRSESLGNFLVQRGVITSEDLEQSLADLAKSEIHHGEIMVAGGMMDAPRMALNLVEHQEEKLLNTFPWFDGSFEFVPGTDWPSTILITPIRTYQTIFQGILRWYDPSVLSSWMGLEEETAIRRIRMPGPDAIVPPLIFRILTHVATPQTLGQIAVKLNVPLEQVIQAAYCLIIAGWTVLDFSARVDVLPAEFIAQKDPETELAERQKHDVVRRWVDEDLERLRSLDFFDLLGVDENAPEREITRAYMERIARYEAQDIETINDETVKSKIVQIRSWLNLAYDTLRDPDLRRVYRKKEKGKKASGINVDGERLIVSALRDLDRNQIDRAIESLEAAHKILPNDISINGYLGWALFQKDRVTHLEKATQMLVEAVKRDPTDAQTHFYLGEIFSYRKDWNKAARLFAQAVNLNPTFVKAAAAYEVAKRRVKH